MIILASTFRYPHCNLFTLDLCCPLFACIQTSYFSTYSLSEVLNGKVKICAKTAKLSTKRFSRSMSICATEWLILNDISECVNLALNRNWQARSIALSFNSRLQRELVRAILFSHFSLSFNPDLPDSTSDLGVGLSIGRGS
jgi:hypothetical protein